MRKGIECCSLDHRIGLGRLRAAAWLDDQTVLVATQAALWRWEPASGAVTPFAQLGAELLTVNRAAGLAAVAVDCPRRELVVLALADGREVRRLPGHDGDIILCLALSPDGRRLASGGSDRMLRIRDIAAGAESLTLEHPGRFSGMLDSPNVVAWSPDGARIATADNEERLWVWEASTGALLFQMRLPYSAGALTFAPDGRQIAAVLKFGGGSISDCLRFLALVDARTGELLHQPETSGPTYYSEDMHAVAYSPDGRFCAIGSENSLPRRLENPAVQIFDTATWQPVKQLPDAPEHSTFRRRVVISSLEYAPDGARLLAASASEVNLGDGQIEFALEVWDARTWTLSARLEDFVSQVNDLALLPGGDLLAATDEGLRRYTAAGTYSTILPGNIYRVAAAPDGSQVVVGYRSFKGEAALLDLQTGAVTEPLPGLTQALINSVAFLSDSRRYAVCHDNYWLRQVGRKSALKKLPPGESNRVDHLSAAASADGKVAFVSWNGTFTVLWGDKFEHSAGWLAHPADRTRADASDFAPPAWAGMPLPAAEWARFSTWQTYSDDCRRLNAAAFSPDGAILALASGFHQRRTQPQDKRGRIYLYRLADQHTRELVTPAEQRWFDAIAWSPDGARIAAGTRNGMICLFDAVSGDFLGEIAAHGAGINTLCFTADGRLISASDDGSLGVWE